MKIFVDANVLIDIITERRPFYNTAVNFISYCANQNYEIITNSLCISNAYYISQKVIRDVRVTKGKLASINSNCKVLPMDQEQLDIALISNFSDFEDALHNACATENYCTHIITRNKNGFRNSKLRVLTPLQFLNQHDPKFQ
jgi:predicted nucleic acid-binding protein